MPVLRMLGRWVSAAAGLVLMLMAVLVALTVVSGLGFLALGALSVVAVLAVLVIMAIVVICGVMMLHDKIHGMIHHSGKTDADTHPENAHELPTVVHCEPDGSVHAQCVTPD